MTFRRLVGALVVLLGSALVVASLSSPAVAASGKVRSSSATLYRNCFGHPFSYALSGFAPGWTLTVDLVSARGRVVDRARVPASAGASGRGAFRICAGQVWPGRFTVRPRVSWPAATGRSPVALARTHLTLRRPGTTASIAVSPRRPRPKAVVRVRSTVRVARPYGFFPERGAKVRLLVRNRGSWHRVGSVRRTNADGKVAFRVRWRLKGVHKVRVKVVRDAFHGASRSRAVSVRARPPARR